MSIGSQKSICVVESKHGVAAGRFNKNASFHSIADNKHLREKRRTQSCSSKIPLFSQCPTGYLGRVELPQAI